MKHIFCMLIALTLFMPSGFAEEQAGKEKTIRLFAIAGSMKHYYTGNDWVKLDIQQKLELVEQARQGALKINALMVLPAEIYIAELDRMFGQTADVRHIELGQAIKGVAIALKDWDDGSDPDQKLEGYLTPDKG